MKHYILLIAVALMLAACNKNTPVATSLHQPSNPNTWSPAGHVYVRDLTMIDNPYKERYFVDVIAFYTKDSAAEYCTTNRDFSPTSKYPYNAAKYTLLYPEVRLYWVISGYCGWGLFKDTLNLSRHLLVQ